MDDALNDELKSDLEDDNNGSDQERYHFDEEEEGEMEDEDDNDRIDDPTNGEPIMKDSDDEENPRNRYAKMGIEDEEKYGFR